MGARWSCSRREAHAKDAASILCSWLTAVRSRVCLVWPAAWAHCGGGCSGRCAWRATSRAGSGRAAMRSSLGPGRVGPREHTGEERREVPVESSPSVRAVGALPCGPARGLAASSLVGTRACCAGEHLCLAGVLGERPGACLRCHRLLRLQPPTTGAHWRVITILGLVTWSVPVAVLGRSGVRPCARWRVSVAWSSVLAGSVAGGRVSFRFGAFPRRG